MSTRTAPKRPKYDACIKALQPAGPSESALAPASMRACTTAVCPIWAARIRGVNPCLSFIFTSAPASIMARTTSRPPPKDDQRSEEHTSELQSRFDLVCRLLLEKKKK